jgi:flagellar FliL protein
MADEKDRDQEEAEAKAPSGKGGKLKLILILAGVVVLLGGGGVGAYLFLSGGGKQDAEASAEHAPAALAAPALDLELSPFLVNLADPGGGHYLKTTLTLELQNEAASNWINGHLPKVRDRVLLLLSSKETAELLSSDGKFRLRDDVLKAVNEMMGQDKVTAVYLTEFVVQ